MEYRSLGRTGLKVSPLCLGCMMFGPRGNNDHDDCIRIIHRALDAGINFLDTANVYSSGVSEEIVGKALKGRRDEVVVATKVHGMMGPGPNDRGNGRRHITQQVEASLRRLQTDYIDLYQIHRPDLDTPIEETMGALDDLVHQGKVRYLGSSTFAAWQLVESYWASDRLRLERFVCEQPPYSILSRGIEREVLPVCDKYGTGVIPWSPLHRGYLSGKYRLGEAPPADSRAKRDQFFEPLESASGRRKLEIVAEVAHLADELDVSLAQYALAWTLANPVVTAPIIGPRVMDQLESVLRVPEIRIPFEHLTRIDQLVAPGTDL